MAPRYQILKISKLNIVIFSLFYGTQSTPQDSNVVYHKRESAMTDAMMMQQSPRNNNMKIEENTTPRSIIKPTHLDSSGLMFSIKNQTGFNAKHRKRFVDKHKQTLFRKRNSA